MAPSVEEAAVELKKVGLVVPFTGPVFKSRPKRYARFVMDLAERGLVRFGASRRATLRAFSRELPNAW